MGPSGFHHGVRGFNGKNSAACAICVSAVWCGIHVLEGHFFSTSWILNYVNYTLDSQINGMWKESGFLSEFAHGIRIKIHCGNLPYGTTLRVFCVRNGRRFRTESTCNSKSTRNLRPICAQQTLCAQTLDGFDKWGSLYLDLHGCTFCCRYIRSVSYFDLAIEVNGGKSTINPYVRHILTRCGFKIRTARFLLWFFVDEILQMSSILPLLSIFGMQRKSAAYPPYVGVP